MTGAVSLTVQESERLNAGVTHLMRVKKNITLELRRFLLFVLPTSQSTSTH